LVFKKQRLVVKKMNYKGIILAGGLGTRLYPLTLSVSKQILPVYNKPMIYYPLSILMQADIRDVLIISSERDIEVYYELLGDGRLLGMNFVYEVQENPDGIASAFILGEDFIGNDGVCLILGDNIFYGDMNKYLRKAKLKKEGATVFAYHVNNPSEYGVVSFYDDGQPMKIIEKPKDPPSPYAVTGLYFYDNKVINLAKNLTPSARGELEITDVNTSYLDSNQLTVEKLPRGIAWLDTGTHDSLLLAGAFVETVEKRTGQMIGCIEEIAYNKKFIDENALFAISELTYKTTYGQYLRNLIPNNKQRY
jgi:glucose-1-phosphate thymidylyltransferase